MTEVNPRFVERWVDVYFEKLQKDGIEIARQWFATFVPDRSKAMVLYKIRQRSGTV